MTFFAPYFSKYEIFFVILQPFVTKKVQIMNYKNYILLFLTTILSCFLMPAEADAANDPKAKELFNKVYNLVFGPQGSALSYKVNIVGLYKTNGSIVYKGKKVHYSEARFDAWEDGTTAYKVDKKKKEVNIYATNDDNKDKYMSKFKYNLNDFDYSYKTEGDYYLITGKVRNSSFFGIKAMTCKVRKSNLYPVSIKIKVGIMSTTVQITSFRSGNIADSNFIFPKDKFKGYKFINHKQ